MKEGFIEVYDNILPIETENLLEDSLFSKRNDYNIPLFYNTSLTTPEFEGGDITDYGFGGDFWTNDDFLPPLDPWKFILSSPLFLLSSYLRFNILNLMFGRVYLQLPDPNPRIQEPHIDIKDTPHWVCLYYVNDSDGDTIFYQNDKITEIKRISPKKGRIAFFDGSVYHSGSKPSTTPRGVINISFLGRYI